MLTVPPGVEYSDWTQWFSVYFSGTSRCSNFLLKLNSQLSDGAKLWTIWWVLRTSLGTTSLLTYKCLGFLHVWAYLEVKNRAYWEWIFTNLNISTCFIYQHVFKVKVNEVYELELLIFVQMKQSALQKDAPHWSLHPICVQLYAVFVIRWTVSIEKQFVWWCLRCCVFLFVGWVTVP